MPKSPRRIALPYNRYVAGSRSDPGVWEQDWNRTFILDPPGAPVGGVLLLHGLTDSPYSMRSIGVMLAAQGFKVVGLRLPGHGTAPAANESRRSRRPQPRRHDWPCAICVHNVGAQKPLYMIGYSNGAALAVNYSLDALDDPALPAPAGLVLISPAIGIYKARRDRPNRGSGSAELPGFGRVAWQVNRARDRSLQVPVVQLSRRRRHADD